MPRKSTRRSKSQALHTAAVEALENRWLLSTTTVNGTSAADIIVCDYSGSAYTVFVNGNAIAGGPTTGSSLFINGLGGDDSITIKRVHAGDDIIVDPGEGQNFTTVGNGNLGSDIADEVDVKQTSSQGADKLIINDSVKGSAQHDDLHINSTSVIVSNSAGGIITFPAALATKTLNRSDQPDNIYVDATTPNLTINLGDGVNNVYYGGSSKVVFGTLSNMTLNGGVNTDTVLFDDTNGGQLNQFYTVTPTSVMNQTLTGFENATINARVGSLSNINQFNISGVPTNQFGSTTINGGFNNVTSIGTSSSPIDLNHVTGTLVINDHGPHTMTVQETGNLPGGVTTNAFQPGSAGALELEHPGAAGNLLISFPSAPILTMNAGSTHNDYFMQDLPAATQLFINGGGVRIVFSSPTPRPLSNRLFMARPFSTEAAETIPSRWTIRRAPAAAGTITIFNPLGSQRAEPISPGQPMSSTSR